MNPKNSLQQFIKDGLVGVVITLIPIVILIVIRIFQISFDDMRETIGFLFFFQDPNDISPMPVVMMIGFISAGIGGRFVENVTSRWSILKPIFAIAVVSWTIDVVFSQIVVFVGSGSLDWNIAGIPTASAGVGLLLVGLVGVIFNPTKRSYRLIIGLIVSVIVSYTTGIALLM